MNKPPKFGKTIDETALDSEGSTLSIETNYQHGIPRMPRYRHYEYRIRVFNSQEEMAEYLKFCDEKRGKLKSSFDTEETKAGKQEGWYYAIKKWTEQVDE